MAYTTKKQSDGEHLVYQSDLHWMTLVHPFQWPYYFVLFKPLRDYFFAEFSITNRRVIAKEGVIARHTKEMTIDRVENVEIRQSILGRVLGYGAIRVKGTGTSIEGFNYVKAPLAFRQALYSTTGRAD